MRGQATLGPPIRPCSAWGLPCPLRFRRGGALLPHPFTLTPVLSGAVYSLRHFPSRCHGRALPGMPPVVESGPSSETGVSADARLLQPRQGYHLVVRCALPSAQNCPETKPFVPVRVPVPVPGTIKGALAHRFGESIRTESVRPLEHLIGNVDGQGNGNVS